MPVVLVWQEGRLNFYLTMGWLMSGELPQLPPSLFGQKHLVLLSALGLSGERMLLSSIMRIQYLSNQSRSFWIKQQTDFDHISTITGDTEDKFPPCISFPNKMCFAGHSFTRSVQILTCLHWQILSSSTFRACNLFFLSRLYSLIYSPIWFHLWFNSSLTCTCPFILLFFSHLLTIWPFLDLI